MRYIVLDLTRVMLRRARALVIAAGVTATLACSDGTGPAEPGSLETLPPPGATPPPASPTPPAPVRDLAIAITGGDNQLATVGSALPTPLTVRVSDANGNAVAGISVVFTVAWGSGLLDGQPAKTVMTDETGRASVSWILGPGAQTNTVNAALA